MAVLDPDADGDGLSDADEVIVGNNPLDSDSIFKITNIPSCGTSTNFIDTAPIPDDGRRFYRVGVEP